MKQLVCVFSVFVFFQVQAQTLSVDYIYSSAFENNGKTQGYHLEANDTGALYTSDSLDLSSVDKNKIMEVSDGVYMVEESPGYYVTYNRKPYSYYKNYLTDSLVYNQILYNREKYIYDKLDRMQWKIEEGKIEDYMGFKCQKATTENRGRKWEVLFTTDLNFNAAPWKFYGLPGVILSAKTDDGFFNFKATKVKVLPENIKISNPFEHKHIISLDAYVAEYKKILDNIVGSLKVDDPSSSSTASVDTSGSIEKILTYETKN